jgi:hypothetical protein
MSLPKAHAALRRTLEGFTQRDDRGDLWSGSVMVRVPPSDLPVPGLVLFLLTTVMGMRNLGREEKTAWHVAVGFRGHRVTVANQKFGLRVYVVPVEGSTEPAEQIAKDVVRRLQKAVGILEQTLLADHAKQQLDDGYLTIANQAVSLRAMYQHFREGARKAFAESEASPGIPAAGVAVDSLFAAITARLEQSERGAWLAIAAVNAYFSALEHEFVLISAFSDLDPAGGALKSFIGDRWSHKLQKLFDLADPETKRMHDALHNIAERYRNPYNHGGFEKQGGALWIHLDGIGAVPARLSDYRHSPHFELFPVQPESFTELCAKLDAVDRWLLDGTYEAAFRWIRAGLNVAFDPGSRDEYRSLAADAEKLDAALERQLYLADQQANFDW